MLTLGSIFYIELQLDEIVEALLHRVEVVVVLLQVIMCVIHDLLDRVAMLVVRRFDDLEFGKLAEAAHVEAEMLV